MERSARHVAQFVRDVETRFPRHQQVVLTGGKDSQLIWLAPKADASRWHVLSAEPNRPIVAAWMERNGVWPGRVFGQLPGLGVVGGLGEAEGGGVVGGQDLGVVAGPPPGGPHSRLA